MSNNEYRVDAMISDYKDTLDADPEWSGPANDYFHSRRKDIIRDLDMLDILKKHLKIEHIDRKDETTDFKEKWILMLKNNWNFDELNEEESKMIKEWFEDEQQ